MNEIRRPFIPQFTVRWILVLTAIMAVASLILEYAAQENAFAAAFIFGLITLMTVFLVYVTMFAAVSLFGRLLIKSRFNGRSESDAKNSNAADMMPGMSPPSKNEAPESIRRTLLWGAIFASLTLSAGKAWAGSGVALQMPHLSPGEVNTTGLTLTLNNAWVDSSGYRPVRISVNSVAGPVPADRVLTVTFRAMQGYTTKESVAVTQTLEIPTGGSSADITLATPQLCTWGTFALDVYEDGQYVKQLSISDNSGWTMWGGTPKGESASPVTLVLSGVGKISGSFLVNPTMELLCLAPENPAAVIDSQITNAAARAQTTMGNGAAAPSTTSAGLSLADLPSRWIDYSGFDCMLISLEKLQEFDAQKLAPPQLPAIREWLHNGGTFIVYDAGERWQNMAELERLTGQNNSSNATSAEEQDPVKRGWNLPLESLRDQPLLSDIATWNTATGNTTAETAGAENNADQSSTTFVTRDKAPFITRPCGLGLVVAIPSNESIGSNYPWLWLFNTVGPQRWQWSRRWGVSLSQNNDDFWRFLIPGVGLVPVLQFQILITVFAVLVGPVNYYLLRRWGKLNLTVLTVPAGALLFIAALLLYAFVADGLGVRARARSFTHIDQRSGEATCWTKLSYYAGLAPSNGLTFAEDTAVIPLTPQPLADTDSHSRTLNWEHADRTNLSSPLAQQLTTGWLDSRKPTQFVTARIRKCTEHLEIQSAANGKPPQVKNQLGTAIQQLLLVDEYGHCFMANNVATGANVTLQAAESQSSAFLQKLMPLIDANLMDVSLMAPPAGHGLFGFAISSHRNRNQYGVGIPRNAAVNSGAPIYAGVGILSQSLADLQHQLLNDSLPARTYVAIVDSSPEVQWGTAAAQPEESLQVIEGQW